MPCDVQPNPYSEYPIKEISNLMEIFFEVSDNLLQTAENIRSYSGFTNTYREFLIAYPWRYYLTHDGNEMSSEDLIELLDRYEQISTYDLVSESIQHKKNIEENPLLITEYNKCSNRINQIQLAMQETNLPRNEIEQLRISRENAYTELEYFENYKLEHGYTNTELHEFSFIENMDVLSEFDVIIRFCSSGYLNNGSFMWIKDQNQLNYHYTNTENEIEKGIKIVNHILSYSAVDTTHNDRLETSLINLFTSINGNNNAPIFDDNIKNKELNVLVIPEGSTNLFPMELIPLRFESDTTEYYYYGEFANITYAPSLSAYIQFTNRDQEKKKKKKALLVSANPETESTTSYVNNLLAFRSDLGNIEFVDDEIKAISKILSRRKFRKKRATPIVLNSSNVSENKVKSLDLSEYSYIHFASHGVHDDENPKYSGILLGREENDYEDGILQAHEIFPLNLNAELVVLSSCFSGFGEIDPNEGNLGIYRSFLIAGAKSVIVSLWPVEDESTAILFTKFYEYHQQGKSKAEALRLAKMHLKNETEFSHPFFWAPFILIGES
jgi:CHAT domain-containing protein